MKPPWEGTWNAVRYRSAAVDHVESYFLKATAPDAERAVWLKATILASAADGPGRAVAEGWAIAFDHREAERHNVAVKHTVPLSQASFDERDLGVQWSEPSTGDAMSLAPGTTRGAISSGAHRIEWDLSFSERDRPLVLFPHPKMYTGPLPKTKQVSPHPDVPMSGEVAVDGDRWNLEGWLGMQGHNWGAGHVELYAWCHCNQWHQEEELVVEVAAGRVRLGPVLLPVLNVVAVRHRGVDYPFNGPRSMLTSRADIGLRRFTFASRSRHGRIEGIFEAPVEDFVGLRYPNPSGPITHCLNSKLAKGRLRLEPHDAPPVELSTDAAALEVGTFRADHGVKMYA